MDRKLKRKFQDQDHPWAEVFRCSSHTALSK